MSKRWQVGDECFAKYREDGLCYHAMVMEVTGDTYTVVFMDYGNHQPATPAEHMWETPRALGQEELLAAAVAEPAAAPEKATSTLDQLAQLDKEIEKTAIAEAAMMLAEPPRKTPSKAQLPAAPLPPPPPPPPPQQHDAAQAALRAQKRIEMAAQLLGVSPITLVEEREEEPPSGPYFGIELRDLFVRDGTAVPKVLIAAADELRKRAHIEGIFRIPGRANVVASMVDAADKGQLMNIAKYETPEIASFLKKFFALLPSPVIPGDMVDRFGTSHNDKWALCSELRQLVDQALPEERTEVLAFSLDLLNYIAVRSDQNKMTSKNLATVFLPALFFSVQGDSTSPEEIMKMAVLGKAVSQTLAFMIDNPKLDCNAIVDKEPTGTSITIPAGGSGGSSSVTASPQAGRLSRSGSQKSSSGPPTPVSSLKQAAARRRSNTTPDKDFLNLSSASDGKLSAESVLAAMRRQKDRMVRRGGTFNSGDGSFFVGRRGWMTVGKRPLWFLIVNDWLYWFKDEQPNVNTKPSNLAKTLSSFMGNVLMSRCNVSTRRPRELEVIQPVGPTTVLVADSDQDYEDWLLSLVEISVAGFPLPIRLDPDPKRTLKEDWVTLREYEKLFARLTETMLVISRDESGTSIFRAFQLDSATVAKGKRNGNAAFVIADFKEKLVVQLHNPGAAQEWVDAIRGAIVIAYACKSEPGVVATLRVSKRPA